MRQLPARKPGFWMVCADFLLRGRTLRWNMAAALGAILVIALGLGIWSSLGPAGRAHPGRVLVSMRLYAPDAGSVSVAGTFNKWSTDAHRMTRGESGFWTITVPLEPGDYTYMFVVDGKAWVTDPEAESYRDDGFGAQNAVLRVKT
jgi:hypothetical protein